jgi:hypothetical protein
MTAVVLVGFHTHPDLFQIPYDSLGLSADVADEDNKKVSLVEVAAEEAERNPNELALGE